jgi:hypothetical protein
MQETRQQVPPIYGQIIASWSALVDRLVPVTGMESDAAESGENQSLTAETIPDSTRENEGSTGATPGSSGAGDSSWIDGVA